MPPVRSRPARPAPDTRCAPRRTSALYAALLEQWLGTEPGGIIPDAARVARPVLVK